MYISKILSFLKREWAFFRQLRVDAAEKKIPEEQLAYSLIKEVLGHNFSILLALATFIATFGLLSNSAATIIGAMIVAPLMVPIMGLAYALVILNFRLLNYSLVRLIYGIILTVLIAFVSTEIIGFRIPESEILARSEPTLLDLGVAIAAGTAGAFAKINRSISDAIPGVAIAVALVPPLCVVGIGLGVSDLPLSGGAFILFLTNLFGIILSAVLVFAAQSYGSWRKAMWGLFLLLASVIMIALPLNFSFREMIAENKIRHVLSQYDIRYSQEGKVYISAVEVRVQEDELWVILDVINTPERLAQKDLKERLELIRKYLSKIVGEPVHLRVRYLPVGILDYEISAPSTENN
jgi:uncharacterized hydrophobic protein (TIGR00271 family)